MTNMKTVLISGAGSGIGRATAEILAASGCRTVLMGRRTETLEATRAGLSRSQEHLLAVADVRASSSVREALARTGISAIDAVVANAGVGGENHYGDQDRWQEVIDTNLTGTYHLVQECAPYLDRAEGYRHVVIVSSILARLGVPGYSAYCASKAGLLGLMRSWAVAWASKKILVNAICPGWVETDMATQGLRTFAETTGKSYEEIYRQQMAMVPLRKMSSPVEIGHFIAFLLSENQTSLTGQTLDMNNGALMP